MFTFQTKKSLLKFLRQTMNASSCLRYCELGALYYDEGLVEAATSYFCRNFEVVSHSPHFIQNTTLEDFADILENETITVKDESIILLSIVSWVKFDVENRLNGLDILLPFVQWNQLSESHLNSFFLQFPQYKGKLQKTL